MRMLNTNLSVRLQTLNSYCSGEGIKTKFLEASFRSMNLAICSQELKYASLFSRKR